jgi:transcriptional regulator with XRE-family HTH domain
MSTRKLQPSFDRIAFNATGFAKLLHEKRRELGWSTRELASRAKVSQPYIVALERARSSKSRVKKTPTPTVDVVAQIAYALNIDPSELFNKAMQIANRHVLLVVDDSAPEPLQIVKRASINQPHTWLCAAKSGDINLRQTKSKQYKSTDIAESLNAEMQRLRSEIAGKKLGLVFSETSEAMTEVQNPHAVVKFEHKWADVVDKATTSVDAQAAFNICVYKIADLNTLADPNKVFNELVEVHDELWTYTNSTLMLAKASTKKQCMTTVCELLKS